jgi:hypothetical protein
VCVWLLLGGNVSGKFIGDVHSWEMFVVRIWSSDANHVVFSVGQRQRQGVKGRWQACNTERWNTGAEAP